MPLKVIETYAPEQNCLIYTGQIQGKITDKNKLFLGKVADIPQLPKNKRFNLRIRGRDSEGNRYVPLMCHARTDGTGTLYIADKYKPEIDRALEIIPDEPEIPVLPQPTKLALVINNTLRRRN